MASNFGGGVLSASATPTGGTAAPANTYARPMSTSGVADVLGGLSGIAGKLVGALPAMSANIDKTAVAPLSAEYAKIGEAVAQGAMTPAAARTNKITLDRKVQSELDSTQKALYLQDTGQRAFESQVQMLEASTKAREAVKIGEANGLSDDAAFAFGTKHLNKMSNLNRDVAQHTAEDNVRKFTNSEDAASATKTYSTAFSMEDTMLANQLNLPVLTGAADLNSPLDQKSILDLATNTRQAMTLRESNIRSDLTSQGKSIAYINAAVTAANSNLLIAVTGLESTVTLHRKNAVSFIKASQNENKSQLMNMGMIGKMMAFDESGYVASAFFKHMAQSKDAEIKKLVKQFTETETFTPTPARKKESPIQQIFNVIKIEETILNEKDKESVYELTQRASLSVKSFQESSKLSPTDLKDYSNLTINFAQGIERGTDYRRQGDQATQLLTPQHKKFVNELPDLTRNTVHIELANTGLNMTRQAASKTSIKGAIFYNVNTGNYQINQDVVTAATPSNAAQAMMVPNASTTKLAEIKDLDNQIKALNIGLELYSSNISSHTQTKGKYTLEQIRYLQAQTISATTGGLITVNGKVTLPKNIEVKKDGSVNMLGLEDLLNQARSTINATKQRMIGGPNTPEKTVPKPPANPVVKYNPR
tara:strand:+ start:5779 stop:7725 length:1947 start_codon:yes stop_codon:yes gene_type:complete